MTVEPLPSPGGRFPRPAFTALAGAGDRLYGLTEDGTVYMLDNDPEGNPSSWVKLDLACFERIRTGPE
jgi:hypothetical protein